MWQPITVISLEPETGGFVSCSLGSKRVQSLLGGFAGGLCGELNLIVSFCLLELVSGLSSQNCIWVFILQRIS